MDYSVKELSAKYEALWEQQDNLYCEISKITKRQDRIEDYNDSCIKPKIIKINKEYEDIIKQMFFVDKNLHEILDIIKLINNNQTNINNEIAYIKSNRNYKMMFYVACLLVIYFIYK